MKAILRIERESFADEAWDREYFDEYLEFPREAYFVVALIGERVAGYAVAVRTTYGAELDSIAVSKRARRRGVARELLGWLIRVLRRRKAKGFTLMVRMENAPAIALYRSFGFKRARRLNGYYPDGGAAWRMRLKLE